MLTARNDHLEKKLKELENENKLLKDKSLNQDELIDPIVNLAKVCEQINNNPAINEVLEELIRIQFKKNGMKID